MDSRFKENNTSDAKGPHCHETICISGPSVLTIRDQSPQPVIDNPTHREVQPEIYEDMGGDEEVSLVQRVHTFRMGKTRNQLSRRTPDLPVTRSQSQVVHHSSDTPSHSTSKVQKRASFPAQNRYNASKLQNYIENQFAREREQIRESLVQARQYANQCGADQREYVDRKFDTEREYVENRFADEQERHDREINDLKQKLSKSNKKIKASSEKSADDTIKQVWDILGFNIRNVICMLRCYQPKGDAKMLETLRSRLPSISFDNTTEESFQDLFEAYAEAFIWKFVYTEIFSGHGCQWRTSVIKLAQETKREITSTRSTPESGSDAHKRTETALWFSQGRQAVVDHLDMGLQQRMADEFTVSLLSMVQPTPTNLHQQKIKDVLGVVVHDATELTLHFFSSKALFVPDWPMQEQLHRAWVVSDFYDENITENGATTRFVVTRPALEKFGNADGENHHHSVVLCDPALVYF